jgi:hypothetical protein
LAKEQFLSFDKSVKTKLLCEACRLRRAMLRMAKKRPPLFEKRGHQKLFSTSGGSVEDEAKREKSVFPFCCRQEPENLPKVVNS